MTNRGQKAGEGGKSGSFFFFTEDKNFMIKTIRKSEFKHLLKKLK